MEWEKKQIKNKKDLQSETKLWCKKRIKAWYNDNSKHNMDEERRKKRTMKKFK